ncbi:hypothetical protein CRE_10681 [Caenorhabditis remanei]|uniref:Bestrophin homolog n=1 Tax=Caenorhabditis remanei TaxID=31234 RepID=E3NIL9_CAERE|nr:hypothetical protein CRE_10681 [Caenorhabditis remanei]
MFRGVNNISFTFSVHWFYSIAFSPSFTQDGSLWKSVRWELTMWILAFAVVQCLYRYLMTENQQRFFEYAAIHLNVLLVHIPLTFMLGFFVTIVVDRWRSVFTNIGFIENVALSVGTLVAGTDHAAKNIKEFRQSVEMLTKYDWVPIPIAYPQVVFLVVRVYFIICLISRQYLLSAPPTEAQSIVPIMTILQFVFFVGWMKVAEALLNPLGEDDDDFECNWLIDRNMSTGIEIVDTCHDSCPPLKLEEPDDEKGTMYWCHPTKNGSEAPPTAVAVSQHKNPFLKVLIMVHPTTSESSPPSYRSETINIYEDYCFICDCFIIRISQCINASQVRLSIKNL